LKINLEDDIVKIEQIRGNILERAKCMQPALLSCRAGHIITLKEGKNRILRDSSLKSFLIQILVFKLAVIASLFNKQMRLAVTAKYLNNS